MTGLPYLPASELADRIRAGDLRPTEVVEAFLDRIAAHDDRINAFVHVREEGAREAARAAERAVEDGADVGPLHGVPVAVKDLTDVAELPTTYGSIPFEDNVVDADATIVRRLREAGAIVLGKTNTPEFGRKPMTTNYLHGTTANPWDVGRTAGGSSGGSAAALAAGLVPLATGSDAAGSLRIPASACGVCGFMPDFGRVPSGPGRPDAFVDTQPYATAGPMARTVEDVALFLDVVAGPDDADPYSLPPRRRSYVEAIRNPAVEGWDVAYTPDLGICPVEDGVAELVAEAAGALADAGAAVHRDDPDFEDWATVHDPISVLLQQRYLGMYENFREQLGIDLLARRDEVTDEVISRIEAARELEAGDVRRAERRRTDTYEAFQAFLGEYDLVVTPTLGLEPFPKGTKPGSIDGVGIDPLHGWALTWPCNLTGNPAISVPAGFVDGIPVGLQIVGPRLADDRVLAAARTLETHRPWHDAYDNLADGPGA